MKFATGWEFQLRNVQDGLHFSGYVLVLSKNSYKKFARLMLMKFATGWEFQLRHVQDGLRQ